MYHIYKKKNNSHFFLESISDIQNIDLNAIETYLDTLNLSIQKVCLVYLGPKPNVVSFLDKPSERHRSTKPGKYADEMSKLTPKQLKARQRVPNLGFPKVVSILR